MPRKRLTIKQARFVKEMADPNIKSATRAAVNAGYAPLTAGVTAYENLQKPYIFEQIEMRKQRAARLANVTQEQVMGATAAIAFSSIEDVTDEYGMLDFPKAVKTGAVDNIKKISRTPGKYGDSVSWEMHSKPDALAKLGNYIGIEKFQTGANNLTDQDLAKELLYRLVNNRGWSQEKAEAGIKKRFPDLDIKLLNENNPD